MDFKYHHLTLSLLYFKHLDFVNTDNRGKTITSPEILPYQYTAKTLSSELKINDIDKSLSILANLKKHDCLESRYNKKMDEIIFWISEKGRLKYLERYFVYKLKTQKQERTLVVLKYLFYFISTVGIISSVIYNTISTDKLLNKIESSNCYYKNDFLKIDSLIKCQEDSLTILRIKDTIE